MLEEYEAACAIVKRMQEIVVEKYCLPHEKRDYEIIGMPEVDHDTVRFRFLISSPFSRVYKEDDFFMSRISHECSFPSAWLDMSNDEIKEEIQEKRRIEKEAEDRLSNERLSMMLEAGAEIEEKQDWNGNFILLGDGTYTRVEKLYTLDEATVQWNLINMKSRVEEKKKKAEEQTRNELALLAELKNKYPQA